MIEVKSTLNLSNNGVKVLVYGDSGAGKTTLIKTCEKPLVLSAESGLLPLRKIDVPYIPIHSLDDLNEACGYISQHMTEYKTIVLDSLSEIAEVTLATAKIGVKDARQAYLKMQEDMINIIRYFRDLPINVYFAAKQEMTKGENGYLCYCPAMPGTKIAQQLPYFFDEVFALRVGKDKDGNTYRFLQTDKDGNYDGLKDRSGALQFFEEPDLQAIFKKIQTEVTR